MTEASTAMDGPCPKRPGNSAGPDSAALSSKRLFPPGRKEIRIDHDGTEYRLRITRLNKLILYR